MIRRPFFQKSSAISLVQLQDPQSISGNVGVVFPSTSMAGSTGPTILGSWLSWPLLIAGASYNFPQTSVSSMLK